MGLLDDAEKDLKGLDPAKIEQIAREHNISMEDAKKKLMEMQKKDK